MTEQGWLESSETGKMLAFVSLSDRKMRLFACACARYVWPQLKSEASRRAVEVAESYADGEETIEELIDMYYRAPLEQITSAFSVSDLGWVACAESHTGTDIKDYFTCRTHPKELDGPACNLLRDIAGDPFKPVILGRECDRCNGTGKRSHRLIDAGGEIYDEISLYCKQCLGTGRIGTRDWITPTISQLAKWAYQERQEDGTLDPFRLVNLADALEEAGCDDENILQHLRGKERCWRCEVELAGASAQIGKAKATPVYVPQCTHCQGSGWRAMRGYHVRGCWAVDLVLGCS